MDKMANKVNITKSKLDLLATSVSNKSGVALPLTIDQMKTAIDEMNIGNVSEIIDNPEYFYNECVDTVQKINTLRNSHTFIMYFITDSHVYTSSNNMQYLDAQLASLYAISKMIKPDLVVHGGDMTNGSEAKEITLAYTKHIVNCLKEINGDNTLILIGNHDGNTVQNTLDNEEERITEEEMLSLYRSWDDGFTYAGSNYKGGNFYGYKDYPTLNLRVIRLHSYRENIGTDGYYGGQGLNWGYYDAQASWFENVALDTDKEILILSHQTLSPVLQGYAESSKIPYNGQRIQRAIDSWLNADANHRCVGVVHGHVHWDYSAKGKGTFTVIDHSSKSLISRTGSYGDFYEHGLGFSNYLTSLPGADTTPSSSYRDVPADAIFYGRVSGTTSQGLWTAVIVDTEQDTINFVRFGAGADRGYSYGPVNYYSITNNLTGATTSNNATLIEDGAAYKATITPNSGYTIDDYSVFMGDVDITSSVYSNGIVNIPAVTGDIVITIIASKPKVNMLLQAVDASGNPYNNGQGWKSGYRLSSSGNESASSSNQVTGFIPMTKGQTMTLENIELPATNYSGYNTCYIAVYNSSKVCIKSNYSKDLYAQTANTATKDSNNHIVKITLNTGVSTDISNMAYVRISTLQMSTNSAIYIE